MPLQGGGVLLITIAAAGTVVISSALQRGLQQIRPELDRHSSAALLRRTARFDPDPSRRRIARLVLANQDDVSAARRQWLPGSRLGREPTGSCGAQTTSASRAGPGPTGAIRSLLARAVATLPSSGPQRRCPLLPGPAWRGKPSATAAALCRPPRGSGRCCGLGPPTARPPSRIASSGLGGALARSRYGTPARLR